MTEVTKQHLNDKIKLTYLLIGIFALVVVDITVEILRESSFLEVFSKLLLQTGILGLIAYTTHLVWMKFAQQQIEKKIIEQNLAEAKQEAKVWEMRSKEFTKEFRQYIQSEFTNWQLSKSEKEIALLILQGKSSKEMAKFRFTSERTIRNQCRSIYEKSSFSGKNEFMAYFLERIIKE